VKDFNTLCRKMKIFVVLQKGGYIYMYIHTHIYEGESNENLKYFYLVIY